MGSGSVATAARVEPSPEGLAQAEAAVRAGPLDTNLLSGDYLHRWECVLPIAREIRVAPLEAACCSDKAPTLPNTGRRKL